MERENSILTMLHNERLKEVCRATVINPGDIAQHFEENWNEPLKSDFCTIKGRLVNCVNVKFNE